MKKFKGKHVTINYAKLEKFVNGLTSEIGKIDREPFLWDSAAFAPDLNSIDDVAQFFFIGNSINFSFWNTSHLDVYTYKNLKGSEAMWMALNENRHLLDPKILKTLTILDFETAFGPISMMRERVEALNEVGDILMKDYKGRVVNLLEAHDYDAKKIIPSLTKSFKSWQDSIMSTQINKRAKLFLYMLQLRFTGVVDLKNIHNLSILPDYHIPKLFRDVGILEYSSELASMIDSHEILPTQSVYEHEIRLSSLYIGHKINEKLGISYILLDSVLWQMAKSIQKPYHMTETIYY